MGPDLEAGRRGAVPPHAQPDDQRVATLLIGEAIFFGSLWVLAWAGLFIAINFAFFLLAEEPGLERRFGDEYRAYRRSVPRWLPRREPWQR